MKTKYPWVALIIALVVALDQLTKLLVVKSFRLHEVVPVVPGLFNLTHVRNPGAAFGILAGASGYWRIAFFIAVSCIALGVLAVLVRKTAERLPLAAYALVGGGAVGNLIDRVRFGEVVDFIEWYYRSYHWPTFNIADSAITVGVGLLAIDMLFPRHVEKKGTEDVNRVV
jgi:signal peptidase II